MNTQDWYLHQLNITQYVLHKPHVLKGVTLAQIQTNIRLITVASQPPTQKIFHDILAAINITTDDCLYLTPAQLIMPIAELKHVIWFIDEAIPEPWQQSPLWESKPIIQTTSLTDLSRSPQDKRQLWSRLCQYENYFQTNS